MGGRAREISLFNYWLQRVLFEQRFEYNFIYTLCSYSAIFFLHQVEYKCIESKMKEKRRTTHKKGKSFSFQLMLRDRLMVIFPRPAKKKSFRLFFLSFRRTIFRLSFIHSAVAVCMRFSYEQSPTAIWLHSTRYMYHQMYLETSESERVRWNKLCMEYCFFCLFCTSKIFLMFCMRCCCMMLMMLFVCLGLCVCLCVVYMQLSTFTSRTCVKCICCSLYSPKWRALSCNMYHRVYLCANVFEECAERDFWQ